MKSTNTTFGKFLLGSLLVTSTQAASIRYEGSGDYLTAGNWVGDAIPGSADQARINWNNNLVTLGGTAPDVQNLQTGVNESGTLEINNNGSLTSTGWSMIGTVAGGGATPAVGGLTINNGGTMTTGTHFWSGVDGSTGLTNVNSGGILNVGGILGLGTVNAVDPSGGVATLNINDGGIVNLNNIHASGTSIQPGSILNIYGSGQLLLPAGFEGNLTNYINNGQIVGNDTPGFAGLMIDNSINPGFTTVLTTIPEPSSLGLLGICGASVLLRRRR